MRDLAAELEQETGEWPAAWRPKEGETLVGTVRRYSVGQSMYGQVRTCILEKDDGERVSIWLSSVVLLSAFERERPLIGERIGLRFIGKHPAKGYKRYALIVDRGQVEPEFTPLGGEQEADPFDFAEEVRR